ncbi:MAG: hypothetical protein ACYC8T_14905 [Myxococcaceae bacterium]
MMAWLLASAAGCNFIQQAGDAADCRRALDVVCGCSSVDCSDGGPEIASVLRRCDPAALSAGGRGRVEVCIASARGSYCEIRDGLAASSATLCTLRCTDVAACDLLDACHAFQYAHCDIHLRDGGP